jgi:hypothetical protein
MALTISINQAAAFTVNVGVPGPTGATGPAGPQGPAGPAGAGGVWGSITGTLSNQTDLVSALAGKYSTTNPAGYIDLTTAGLYFYPLTGNPGGFATQAWVISQNYLTASSLDSYATQSWVNTQLAGYALQSWVTDHAYPLTGNPSGFLTSASLSGYATQGWVNTQLEGYATLTYVNASFYGIDNPDGFITSSALSPYLLSSTAASTYQTLAGMSSYLTTSAAASTYAVIARGLPAAGTTGQVLSKVNGTDYNATWTTFIPGDRYLTTSSTSNAVSNGNKTFTVGTGLSYTTQQDVTIAYDAAHHMHGLVLTYNSGTGVMTVDVNSHTGTGTYNSWTVNVGGTVPVASVAWGDITGTIGSQADLSSALNAKLETTTAASTYYLQTNPSGFIGDAPSDGSTYGRNNGAWAVVSGGGGAVWGDITGTITDQSDLYASFVPRTGGNYSGTIYSVDYSGFDVSTFGYTEIISQNTNTGGYSSMSPTGVVKGGNAFSGQFTQIDATGVHFPDGSTQTSAAVPGIPDAPADGALYARQNGTWSNFSTGVPYPSAYNAVWYSGYWYSANVNTVTDGYGNYYNALTF